MPQLKTARLAANDLLSTFPNGMGGLEGDLAAIFGFTPDSDITVSPFSCDNSGRITRDLLKSVGRDSKYPGYPHNVTSGVGLDVNNSSNSKETVFSFESEDGYPRISLRSQSNAVPMFSVYADGTLQGSITQDLTQTPLIPPTSGSDSSYYYDGTGQFSRPGLISFDGCRLIPVKTTINETGANLILTWTAGFDVGGHLGGGGASAYAMTAGKFLVSVSLLVTPYAPSGGINVTAQLVKNGGPTAYAEDIIIDTSSGFPERYLYLSTVVDLSSPTDYMGLYIQNPSGGVILGGNVDPQYNGSMSFFRVG